ncbi:MAG: hypothetical protein AUI63_01900 [Gemmatimonadetes bacterium 13_1_40CM_2_60_3]|nr:MAG: hypothetical protein AUI63_01900 [Gemmatimonadetes bacterium 13_1_40CM_2_60_3]
MLVEASVFRCDKGLLDELRDISFEVDVESTNDLEPAHQSVVTVEDATALIRLKSLYGARCGAAVKTARDQPHVGEVDR